MEKFDFDAIILKPKDNVGTSIKPLKRNTEIILKLEKQLINFVIKENIKLCHKFSLSKIRKGDKIIKYGEIIGVAIDDIQSGNLVHIHNIQSLHHNSKEFLG
tara:strand:- start:965 stop:1270 length:306 start_codon:yes stop_codon:yes gene_type:complete